jgi:hypothetical protein
LTHNEEDFGIGDGLELLLRDQLAAAPEEKPAMPVALPVPPGTFRFRTKVGLRNFVITLRTPIPAEDPELIVKNTNRYEKQMRRVLVGQGMTDPEVKKLFKDEMKLYERWGDRSIRFKPVRGRFEATFTTTDPVIAAYVRSRLPEFGGDVYEDVAPMEVEIGGQRVRVVPADDSSRRAMAQAAVGA